MTPWSCNYYCKTLPKKKQKNKTKPITPNAITVVIQVYALTKFMWDFLQTLQEWILRFPIKLEKFLNSILSENEILLVGMNSRIHSLIFQSTNHLGRYVGGWVVCLFYVLIYIYRERERERERHVRRLVTSVGLVDIHSFEHVIWSWYLVLLKTFIGICEVLWLGGENS